MRRVGLLVGSVFGRVLRRHGGDVLQDLVHFITVETKEKIRQRMRVLINKALISPFALVEDFPVCQHFFEGAVLLVEKRLNA